jgi:hypothetical protein
MPETFTTTKKKASREHLENMNSWIAESHHGLGDLPLEYVIRENVAPPDVVDDPGHTSPTYKDKLIRGAIHADAFYILDSGADCTRRDSPVSLFTTLF